MTATLNISVHSASQPKALTFDRTRREHCAGVNRIVWESDDETRVILALDDESSAVGPGSRSQFEVGQRYRFHGRWTEGRYGPQFQYDTSTLDDPLNEAGVIKYLSQTCTGVGKVIAKALWARWQSDAVRMLRESPSEIAVAGLLTADQAARAASELQRFAKLEKTKVDLFGIFAGRGFPGKLIDRCIAKWGVRAPHVIATNPYALLVNKLPGCGFKRVDKLNLDRGGKPDSLKRQALAGWNAMREDRTGSTWLDADDVVKAIVTAIPGADAVRAIKLLIRAGWVRIRRDRTERNLALRERAIAEHRIADSIVRLSRHPSLWPTEIPASQAEDDGLPSDHQVAELQKATASAVGCFVGGPGTGKTHSLSFLLKQLIDAYGSDAVKVAAPTGKAAVRAGESLRARGLNIRATTIHSLLEIGRNGHDGEGWGFERNLNNPLDVRFLIIDESSMIDTSLAADLLDAMPDGSCVLFVGDTGQLPPVGHGSPLRDILAAGIGQGELIEVRRNAGSIVNACASIKAGTRVNVADTIDLNAASPLNLRVFECGQAEVVETLVDLLKAFKRFDPKWDTQVITALNEKSDVSRKKLNDRLSGLLNPDGKKAAPNRFKVGDKIICTKNSLLKTCQCRTRSTHPDQVGEPNNYGAADPIRVPEEWYVANGELGRVIAVNAKESIVHFGGGDTPLVKVPVGKPKEGESGQGFAGGAAGDFEPAWAITVHKSQGSEWPCVICIIDDAAGMIADRNYWYTAISRAKTLCLLIGPRGTFEKQIKRQSLVRRRTFLTELIRDGMKMSPVSEPTHANERIEDERH